MTSCSASVSERRGVQDVERHAHLADVVQRRGDLELVGGHAIQPQLGAHPAGELGHVVRVTARVRVTAAHGVEQQPHLGVRVRVSQLPPAPVLEGKARQARDLRQQLELPPRDARRGRACAPTARLAPLRARRSGWPPRCPGQSPARSRSGARSGRPGNVTGRLSDSATIASSCPSGRCSPRASTPRPCCATTVSFGRVPVSRSTKQASSAPSSVAAWSVSRSSASTP